MNTTTKTTETSENDEIHLEYDFSSGIRSNHHYAYQHGISIVLLEPDVAKIFRSSEAVNHALRLLIKLAGHETERSVNNTPK